MELEGRPEAKPVRAGGSRRSPVETTPEEIIESHYAPDIAVGRSETAVRREAQAQTTGEPGRFSGYVPPEKPSVDETTFRSRLYVPPRHSADGNGYKPGDPIPVAEAIRQGLAGPAARPAGVRGARHVHVCERCHGAGKTAKSGHRVDCGCPICGPCKACGSTGWSNVTDDAGNIVWSPDQEAAPITEEVPA